MTEESVAQSKPAKHPVTQQMSWITGIFGFIVSLTTAIGAATSTFNMALLAIFSGLAMILIFVSFDLPRFHGIRLYGDRHIDSGETVPVATFRAADGREFKEVFGEPGDAKVAAAFSKIKEDDQTFSLVGIEEMIPRDARWLFNDRVSGPTALIDLARENSMVQKNRISELEADIKSGKKAAQILNDVKKVVSNV